VSENCSIHVFGIFSWSALERIALASAYFALGRVRDAKEQWEKSFSSDTKLDTAVSHARLGEQLVKASALTDALAHFQRAYELDPQNTTFRMEYEAVRQKLGR
jgi:tetratricopeptide (TPR) repeat protein